MEIKTTYKGTLNGVKGLWCGFKPNGLIVDKEISVYYPSEGKIFVKNGQEYTSIILGQNETIDDYIENDKIENIEDNNNDNK